ncbi:PQQ-dependent sugar dehydrogenase [Schleiferia thermophila]|jgi:glucose/arabinose dehydrogenase|uniref:PQQ-dependent sugar dehydrogenase n=1 Tax=Schleiferia thermophila TaxID=884107 RepID=UPI0004E71ED9|nr:PQQ-dependent sugar dehydrogenase [Schleiferia thermophila]KFD39979.1 dehydrogenase [Schleiferia thermophila str. Yellowstone]
MKIVKSLLCTLVVSHLCCQKQNTNPSDKPGIPANLELVKQPVITGLSIPWGMAFLNESEVLIAEKSGDILLANVTTGTKKNIFKVPGAILFGQGGLMDIRLHPDFSKNKLIYFSYSKMADGQPTTALGRAKYSNEAISDFEEIFVANARSNSGVHFGSRIAFDGKGHLFLGLGDRGNMQQAQNTLNHMGCLLRLNEDGSVPEDNPFVGKPDFLPEIWSYGHRNIQGLDFHPTTGKLWAHEHGPQGGDEINIIEPGNNYGWPLATYGEQYGGGTIGPPTYPGTVQPIHHWTPSIAPCGMAFLKSDKYPGLNGNLFIGSLVGQHLNMTRFLNHTLVSETRLFQGEGRIRNVVESPDGYIYFSDETNGILYKLLPVFKE